MREESEDSRLDDHVFVLMRLAMFAAVLDLEEEDDDLGLGGLLSCLPFLGLLVFVGLAVCLEKSCERVERG